MLYFPPCIALSVAYMLPTVAHCRNTYQSKSAMCWDRVAFHSLTDFSAAPSSNYEIPGAGVCVCVWVKLMLFRPLMSCNMRPTVLLLVMQTFVAVRPYPPPRCKHAKPKTMKSGHDVSNM